MRVHVGFVSWGPTDATSAIPPRTLLRACVSVRACEGERGLDTAAAPTPRPTDRHARRQRRPPPRRASNVRLAVRFWLVVGEDPNNPLSAAEEIQHLSHLIHSSYFEEESQTPTRPTW